MSRASSKNIPTGYPEYAVRPEVIRKFFSPPLPKSSFYDLVDKGLIVPMKGVSGRYLLNKSLSKLGLREVPDLPDPPSAPSLEDIVRLAFSLIDQDLFPEPAWMLKADVISKKDIDHAIRLQKQHREPVETYDDIKEKIAYFHGVLDAVSLSQDSDQKS